MTIKPKCAVLSSKESITEEKLSKDNNLAVSIASLKTKKDNLGIFNFLLIWNIYITDPLITVKSKPNASSITISFDLKTLL